MVCYALVSYALCVLCIMAFNFFNMDLFIISILFIQAGIILALVAEGVATNTDRLLIVALSLFLIGIVGTIASTLL